jgi:hypothetical protein
LTLPTHALDVGDAKWESPLFAGEIGDVGVKKGESLKTLQAIVTINQGHRNSEERI